MVRIATAAALLLIGALAANADTATVTAVHAKTTGATETSYDAQSREFDDLLEPLEFDTYTTAAQQQVQLASSGETDIRINDRYTLRLGPAESQPDGHVKCRVEVFGVPRNARAHIKVLEITVRLAPNKPVMIRGLRMEQGEIIAFLERD